MIHLGDITKINGAEIEKVDCITFGSPCQDLSVAGKRAGLDGERSGLFMEAVRIIKEMRNADRNNRGTDVNLRPRFAIWENVPGAFSSNKGEDFRVVLEELIRIKEPGFNVPGCKKWAHAGFIYGDGWSIAWRLMDAQYWGVPQRRKRIALLVDLEGDKAPELLLCDSLESHGNANSTSGKSSVMGASGECSREVQPESESLSGNLEPSITPWKGIARNPEEGVGVDSFTVKIRGGVEKDSNGKQAGKGALIQTDLSATLGVSQDQTLF